MWLDNKKSFPGAPDTPLRPPGYAIGTNGLMAKVDDCLKKICITKADYIASTEGINNVSLHWTIIAETKLSF